MEFIVSTSDLLSQLNTIKGVINSKNTMPILDNFLFTLDGNTLKIEASDLETRLETQLQLENVNGSGIVAIEAKRLTDMLGLFADEPLTFKVDLTNYKIDILSASGKYSIAGASGEDFPTNQPLADTKSSFTIASDVLQKGLASTVFATSDEDSRPILTGILFELTQEHLRLVATDSHKLARYTRTDVKSENEASFIFPKKPATILKAILAKGNNDVQVEFDEKQVVISMGSYVMNCRLIEGRYPNYKAVIPTENPNVLLVNKDEFYKKLRRVAFFSNPANNLARLEMSGTRLLISAQNIDYASSAKEELNCRYEGEDIQIGFKSKFLLTILDNINSEDVSLEMSDPSRAGLIIPVDKEDDNEDVLMLLMPMLI
ncbi:MAG: DNA polymerase III subunit beta [Bacteroidales bacterium]|jgi:DNA polymerase-3 subunit beta|nr:DNA polymerase III subunit beta [Bacteroidales bacterium]MBP5724797.1 DNA polymerase III subunit beta [Bacteroidales bacterium]MBQ3675831.1 DNA polymerase III subunit beta [Bacteroidales bacterium]MBR4497924.1 DNA polymerase III subunit beta [Bacteroidales bacterium]